MSSSIIHVLTVEDQALALEGMRNLVRREHELRLVAACQTRDEALAVFTKEQVDVVLFDLDLYGMREWRTIRRMQELKPAVRIIVISAVQDIDVPRKAFEMTRAFLTKHASNQEIVKAIHDAYSGKDVWPSNLPAPAGDETSSKSKADIDSDESAVPYGLSAGELEVLRLLQDGKSVAEIADMIHLSEWAIRKRTEAIRNKVGLAKLRDLYLWAVKNRPLDNTSESTDSN